MGAGVAMVLAEGASGRASCTEQPRAGAHGMGHTIEAWLHGTGVTGFDLVTIFPLSLQFHAS